MQLIEQTLKANRGHLSKDGALVVKTGASTGRSTKERFVVRRPEVETEINWGGVNQPMTVEKGEALTKAIKNRVLEGEHYSMQGYVGCFKVEVYSKSPWHIAFAENMFRKDVIETLKNQVPDDLTIKIYHDPEGQVSDLSIEHDYNKAIIVDPAQLTVAIIGTAYAGD